MTTITDEQVYLLPSPGTTVTVTKFEEDLFGEDGAGELGYLVTGRFIGLERRPDGPVLRVLPDDGIERKVPLPARVTITVVR